MDIEDPPLVLPPCVKSYGLLGLFFKIQVGILPPPLENLKKKDEYRVTLDQYYRIFSIFLAKNFFYQNLDATYFESERKYCYPSSIRTNNVQFKFIFLSNCQ
jgi:hypothetical protein